MTAVVRKQGDLAKLMMAGYEVDVNDEKCEDFHVKFRAPKDTLYEGGVFRVRVVLPQQYPYHSPSIAFENRIFHPNIDERSGAVCLDVINQTWTPLYSLVNVFDLFLPQLLTYPNMSDPLNTTAAVMWRRDRKKYEDTVKEYVRMYAQP